MAAERLLLQSLRDGVARAGERASRRLGKLATNARLVERVTTLGALPNRLREERRKAMERAEQVGREHALSMAAGLHKLAARLEAVGQPAAVTPPVELH